MAENLSDLLFFIEPKMEGELVNSEIINNKTRYYVNTFNQKKIVPNFLIEKNINIIDINNLLKGLSLVGDYLEKSILKPNNINHPP